MFTVYQMIHHLYHLSLSKYYPFNSKLPNFSSRKMQLFFQFYFTTSITTQTNKQKERKPITSSLLFYHYSNYSLSYHSYYSNYSSLTNIPPLSYPKNKRSSIPQSLLIFHTRHYLNLSAGSLSCYLLSSLESKRSEVSTLVDCPRTRNPLYIVLSGLRVLGHSLFGNKKAAIWEISL